MMVSHAFLGRFGGVGCIGIKELVLLFIMSLIIVVLFGLVLNKLSQTAVF